MRPFPQGMSPACISFVSAMMIRDVQQRPSAKQLLQHPIVLTYLRTLVPAQQQAPAPLAPTSDSASSLNGSAAMPRPLFAIKRPAQGTPATQPGSFHPSRQSYQSRLLTLTEAHRQDVSSLSIPMLVLILCRTSPAVHEAHLSVDIDKHETGESLILQNLCSGPQGTITVSVNGRQQPLSGSFTVSPAQPATTAPELVSTLPSGHCLESSGGSLVKVSPETFPVMVVRRTVACAYGMHG